MTRAISARTAAIVAWSREHPDWTQERIGAQFDCTKQNVSHIERVAGIVRAQSGWHRKAPEDLVHYERKCQGCGQVKVMRSKSHASGIMCHTCRNRQTGEAWRKYPKEITLTCDVCHRTFVKSGRTMAMYLRQHELRPTMATNCPECWERRRAQGFGVRRSSDATEL